MTDFNSIHSKVSGLFIKVWYKVFLSKRIQLAEGVTFYKIPNIRVIEGCELRLGKNVVIGSNKKKYHSFMYNRSKIILDRPGGSISIGSNTRLQGVMVHAYEKIEIGENCLIAANTQIMDGGGHDLCMNCPEKRYETKGDSKPIIIEDNVWLGINCIVLPGSIIRKGTVVGAGSVVRGELKPNSLYAGNPAVLIKEYE